MRLDLRNMRPLRFALHLVPGLIVVAAIACSNAGPMLPVPSPGPAEPTPIPRPVSIPFDEGSHDERLEWWYYNGHLSAESGEEFGFHFVIFQTRDDDGEAAYAAQFGLTDVEAGQHRLDSRLFAGDAETTGTREDNEIFGLQVGDWSLNIGSLSHEVRAIMDTGDSLELELGLTPGQGPVLHAGIGWFAAPTGWSYYYSWPNMPANGLIVLDGVEYQVSGTGWFDHQWGDFFTLGAPGGWQWIGLQLGGGETLMVTETRNPDGSLDTEFGTWNDGAGITRSLTQADGIRIDVLDTWTSPDTGGVYPSRWRLRVESLELDVETEPVVADQEVDQGVPLAAIYWEGKVSHSGTYRGEPIRQAGYVELTGYVQPEAIPWQNR